MRLYYTGASPDNLRQAREHAPSHTHGAGWTPQKMTPHDVPYFLDNGAFTGSFEKGEFLGMLRESEKMPRSPDFVVYPDVLGDARATIERCRDIFRYWHPDELRLLGSFVRYYVLQPGEPLDLQFTFAENVGATGVFVGGSTRWKRSVADEVVSKARGRGFRTHVGRPSGADGLVWAHRTGFDSADTTSVFQNQYWHWLDALEDATEETGEQPDPSDHRQSHFGEVIR